MRVTHVLCVVLLVAVQWSYAGSAPSLEYRDQDHPLVDKIWDVSAKRFVDHDHLAAELSRAHYVLLGETHDNPQHHLQQAWAIEAILKAGRRPSVAFEMITPPQLEKVPVSDRLSADQLFDALNWDHSGWPDRRDYRVLFDTVLAAKLPVRAANLERDELRRLIQAGPAALPPDIADLLDRVVLTEQDDAGMREEIAESHCGALPPQHVEGLSLGQRVRDAVMARALVQARNEHGAVLIAGNGHARLDRGVPAYVRATDPERTLRSVAWQEVREELPAPTDYAVVWGASSLPFDFVWFTARVARPDPCEAFREHMRRKSSPNGEKPKAN